MIKLLSLFSGIGAFETALKRLDIDYDLVGFSEIDKFAVKSYCAVHNVGGNNLGDINNIKTDSLPKDIDLITYGFPCQDISLAGKGKGFVDENGKRTRSGLFFESLRIIKNTKPKVAIAENVKALTGKRFQKEFKIVLDSLEEAGYSNYWKVLNAKHYGIPQNRERVFIVSIRKDLDKGFEFPEPFELTKRLKDLLDDEVDEKFYLSVEQTSRLTGNSFNQANARVQQGDVISTLLARDYKDPKCVQVAQIYLNSGDPQGGRVYDVNGISPTVDTCEYDNRMYGIIANGCDIRPKDCNYKKNRKPRQDQIEVRTDEISNSLLTASNHNMVEIKKNEMIEIDKSSNKPKEIDIANCITAREDRGCSNRKGEGTAIIVREATKKGYAEAEVGDSINFEQPNSKTRRGRVGKGVAQTLTTSMQQGVVIGVMRGRNPENPSDRMPGTPTEQMLEINKSGCSNALTTVQKDNLVIEPKPKLIGGVGEINFGKQFRQGNRIYDSNGVAMSLMSQPVGNAGGNSYLYEMANLRIRKLTPKECWRLMGFYDSDFEKAEAVNSNTQLYKQAGNSIVVDVLVYLFEQIFKYVDF